jgi:hypothetical protein
VARAKNLFAAGVHRPTPLTDFKTRCITTQLVGYCRSRRVRSTASAVLRQRQRVSRLLFGRQSGLVRERLGQMVSRRHPIALSFLSLYLLHSSDYYHICICLFSFTKLIVCVCLFVFCRYPEVMHFCPEVPQILVGTKMVRFYQSFLYINYY